jgi:Domain of unknown function (DUF4277)
MSGVQALPSALASAPARFTLPSERMGPMPLTNHFIERIGLPELLARHIPSDARSSIPHARALGALLRSLVVQREPIYRQQETVHGFAGSMFGISAQDMQHLSDDRLGRALDHLFDADRAALLTEVALAVGERFGVKFDEFHNHSASVSFCGRYSAASGRSVRKRRAPAITFGFSNNVAAEIMLRPPRSRRSRRCARVKRPYT